MLGVARIALLVDRVRCRIGSSAPDRECSAWLAAGAALGLAATTGVGLRSPLVFENARPSDPGVLLRGKSKLFYRLFALRRVD